MMDVGGYLVILVLLGLIYAVICMVEDKLYSDFDEVTEKRCKTCIYYNVCLRHGLDYNCKDYMTEEMLNRRGLEK